MTYEEARNFMEGAGRSGMELGLARIRELLRRLGDPQEKLQFIHIAGTNGKGSTAAYISSVLAASGHMVGRYVSPAVFEYEECIQYEDGDGSHHIGRCLLTETVTKVAAAVEAMQRDGQESPTVFEMETAMAFLAFVHWNCAVVVLEAGLGGRDDATNVVENVLASVITPVAMDHAAVLGGTIGEIAMAKAGIIRRHGVVVTYQDGPGAGTVLEVIRREALDQDAVLHEVGKEDIAVLAAGLDGSTFRYRGGEYRTGMAGLYQVENASLALEVCSHLPEPFAVTAWQKDVGIRKAQWRGRFEVVGTSPLTIIDGAHNPAGARALRVSVEAFLEGMCLHGVMGVLGDKDYEAIVEILAPVFADVVTITPPVERGLDGEILAGIWREQGCPVVSTAVGAAQGLQEALARCGDGGGDAVVVFGSLSFFDIFCSGATG